MDTHIHNKSNNQQQMDGQFVWLDTLDHLSITIEVTVIASLPVPRDGTCESLKTVSLAIITTTRATARVSKVKWANDLAE